MIRVMLGQGVVPVLMLTAHGHVRPISVSGCCGWGGPMAHCLARGFHVSLGRGGSKLRGSGTLMTSQGLGRGKKMPPEMPISLVTLPQGLGGIEFVVRASSD
jgi:hypothetical protein